MKFNRFGDAPLIVVSRNSIKLYDKTLKSYLQLATKTMLQSHQNSHFPFTSDGKLTNKYKKEFPKGDPVTVACQKGRLNDVKTFIQSGTVKDVHTYEGKASTGWITRTLLTTSS